MKDIFFKTLMLKGESGGTITSIEKISAEGGVMQMRMTLSDGQVIDFPVNDIPDTDLINNLISEALKLVKNTILASGWSSSAPYTYDLEVEGVTDQDDYEIIGFEPTGTAETDSAIKEALAYITYGTTSENTITLVAVDNKPTVNIPIVIRKVVS